MNTPFFFEFWDQSHSLRGILLIIIAFCFLMIITDGVSPNNSNPLAILGIAIVCLSMMPKPPEKGRDND